MNPRICPLPPTAILPQAASPEKVTQKYTVVHRGELLAKEKENRKSWEVAPPPPPPRDPGSSFCFPRKRLNSRNQGRGPARARYRFREVPGSLDTGLCPRCPLPPSATWVCAVWHQGGLGSVCTVWFDLLCLCFMGCGRTCPGSRSRTWDLWAKPGTKPAGSTTNPPEHRHPQACEPETSTWCWKPWSRGHVSLSVTAVGSGQMQARSKASAQLLKEEQGLWCRGKRAALGGEPYRGLQSYLLDPRGLQIKTTPTEHSEMGNWDEGTRHEAGDCFH